MQREITLNVPQGIGDIFWAYQKIAPSVETIHLNILCTVADCPVQRRALDWIVLWPQIGRVAMTVVSDERYEAIAHARYDLGAILRANDDGPAEFDYSCNGPLEEGIRLEAIDPEPVEWGVPIATTACKLPRPQFIAGYVTGHRAAGTWELQDWATLFSRVARALSLPVVLIGAEYDRAALDVCGAMLGTLGIDAAIACDWPPGRVLHLLRAARLFIGYQSGLNVLADNMDVRQLMVYFDHLELMQNAWCKPRNIRSRFFSALFREGIETAAARALSGLRRG